MRKKKGDISLWERETRPSDRRGNTCPGTDTDTHRQAHGCLAKARMNSLTPRSLSFLSFSLFQSQCSLIPNSFFSLSRSGWLLYDLSLPFFSPPRSCVTSLFLPFSASRSADKHTWAAWKNWKEPALTALPLTTVYFNLTHFMFWHLLLTVTKAEPSSSVCHDGCNKWEAWQVALVLEERH